jgi:putative tricarboxylic transport membrane protein
MKKIDLLIGIFIIFFSLLLLFILIPNYISYSISFKDIGPQFFPRIISYGLSILGVVIVLASIKDKENKKNKNLFLKKSNLKIGLMFIFSIIYLYLIDLLGYLVPTIIMLGIFIRIYGEKRKVILFTIPIITSILIFIIFGRLLKMLMPRGLLTPFFEFLLY